ncbi:LysR-family transcriptional regulator Bsu YwqM [Acidisarcina polymorpha]|uniref:LysR-family transcriptional regulator Bsu YwqM n=1 Tax=Acidisarcina polymorpha TaxID=2211140 RepID=A0A2Z5G3C2_9BACT|nr:LysR family transcriptional regulator [Acidisarcina polymorpha]AXC13026.1 LysR-family transcriptional regulator Bsu YwqM [Acidisarcina polymorpha]
MEGLLDLRQIRTFIEVARTRSFTKAAAQLYYAQSSITAQVQALEKDLGLPLFNRLGRQVELTEMGRQFLGHAEKLICVAEEARLSVQKNGNIVGPLVVSAAESLLTYRLPALLQGFQSAYPDVQLILHTGASCSSIAPLEAGVDLGITIDEPVEVPQLLVQRVRSERMLTVVAAEHALSKRKEISAVEIAEQQILLTEHGCSYRGLFERTLMQQGGRVNKLLEFASVEALKQCAVARMGVAVLPEMVVAEELKRGVLVALPWPQKRMHVYTQLVRHRDKWFSPVMSAFWTMATQLLREPTE